MPIGRALGWFPPDALPEMLQDRLLNGLSASESVKAAAETIRKVIAS